MAARFLVLLKAETLLATDLMTARRPFFSVTEAALLAGLLAAGKGGRDEKEGWSYKLKGR